jgi:hypothetical protein
VGFPRRLLADHEALVLEIRPHWIALVGPAVVLLLAIVAEILLFTYFDPPSAVRWLALVGGAILLIPHPRLPGLDHVALRRHHRPRDPPLRLAGEAIDGDAT